MEVKRDILPVSVNIGEEIEDLRMVEQHPVDPQLADIYRIFSIDRKNTGLKCIRDLRLPAECQCARGKRTEALQFLSGEGGDQDRFFRPAILIKDEPAARLRGLPRLRNRRHSAGHRHAREEIITPVDELVRILEPACEEGQKKSRIVADEFLLDLSAEHIHRKRCPGILIHDRDHFRSHCRLSHCGNRDHATV